MAVDRATWGDSREVARMTEAKVDASSDADLAMSGTVTVDGEAPGGYARLVLEDGTGRHEVATVWVDSASCEHGGSRDTYEADWYSVLVEAAGHPLRPGWSLPSGSDPVAAALSLLAESMSAPVMQADTEARTSAPKVAEMGETALTMALELLDGTGYRLDVDGHGRVSAVPESMEPVAVGEGGVPVSGTVSEETDLHDVPNVVLVDDGEGRWVEARNDDPASPTSTATLGFERVKHESVSASDGLSLVEAAYRLLDELSGGYRRVTYSREFDPRIRPGSIVSLCLPREGLHGLFRVASQSFGSDGALVTETVESYVDTFRR